MGASKKCALCGREQTEEEDSGLWYTFPCPPSSLEMGPSCAEEKIINPLHQVGEILTKLGGADLVKSVFEGALHAIRFKYGELSDEEKAETAKVNTVKVKFPKGMYL